MIKPEDYIEPACPFCTDAYKKEKPVHPLPVDRIMKRLDEFFETNDTSGAKRHLEYWLGESLREGDMRGRLSLLNEYMGLMRKTGKKEEAVSAAKEACELTESLKLDGTVTHGTTLLNAATVYKHFGFDEIALKTYLSAQEILEKAKSTPPSLLAGLYNNMAIAYTSQKQYEHAKEKYKAALALIEHTEDGTPDAAITYLNMADLIYASKGAEVGEAEISRYLDKAEFLLDSIKDRKDGYYAFVCEKCSSVFGFYGRFIYAADLKKRSEKIYERA